MAAYKKEKKLKKMKERMIEGLIIRYRKCKRPFFFVSLDSMVSCFAERRRKSFFDTAIISWLLNDHAGNSDIHVLGPKGPEKQFQL